MSHDNPRIKSLDLPFPQAAGLLVDGNVGAISAILKCVKAQPTVDPDDAMGPFSVLFSLDNLDCYGPRIWQLFKKVCDQNPLRMLAVMRAIQLGIVRHADVTKAIDGGARLDVDDLLAKVRERLPSFGATPAT